MIKRYISAQPVLWATIFVLSFAPAATVLSQTNYDTASFNGDFVLSVNGAFSSAPPPFTGDVLQLMAAEVGLLSLDGAGTAWGEITISFHHPSIPFAPLSRKALFGNYSVEADGRTIINLDEFSLDANGNPLPVRSNSFVLECYILQRQILAKCLLHSLVSYQQGPEPRILPATMSGTLQRRR